MLQTPVDVEAPSGRARLKALELRHETAVGKTHLGPATLGGDLEGDVGTYPLVGLLGEVEERFLNVPNDSLVREELADLLLGVVDVLVAIGELGAERVGVPFDVARPPSADVVDSREDFLRGLLDDVGSGESLLVMVLSPS